MLIVDCISKMTKFYLKRITNSIVQEQVSKNADEDRLREHIEQNTDHLSNEKRIIEVLSLKNMTRSSRILMDEILSNLLEIQDSICGDDHLFSLINKYEKAVIKKSKDADLSTLIRARDLDIYKTVLKIALEDDVVTKEEFALLEKLREKLKINRFQSRLIEAQLGKFPKNGNNPHERTEYDNTLKDLQSKGIIFYCNKETDKNLVVLPKEIRAGVKKFLGFEMRSESHKLFHNEISKEQLQKISKAFDLPVSGKKECLSERLIEANCKPSEELEVLSNQELYEMCNNLKGVNVSGTKEEKIGRIISYYDNLNLLTPEDTEDPRAKYYQYLEKLAARDNQELYRIKLISRDREMEDYFEQGTRYLFEKKLGCTLMNFDGNDHADGGVGFPDKELLLWDNKSKEKVYLFPETDYKQFKRYINDSLRRIKVFLIIVPEVPKDTEIKAVKLKQETKTDTDVAIITATDLKFIAENWKKLQKSEKFNLNIFNMTGILDRKRIELYLKLY